MCWEEKLEKMFPKICNDMKGGAHAPEPWKASIEAALEKIRDISEGCTRVIQIKPKFGLLNLYVCFVPDTNPEISEAVFKINSNLNAEVAAICIECGGHNNKHDVMVCTSQQLQ